MKTTITTAQAMSHPDVCKEIAAQLDLSRRKLAVLSDAAALENLYQVGLKQEFDITALTKERDALKDAAKLALDALESLFGVPAEYTGVGGGGVAVWRLGGSDQPRTAIAALKAVL